MRDTRKHFNVNWVDGMKINKNHFIDQDNAITDSIQELAAINLSAVRFGILPPSVDGEDTYNIKMAIDNQNSLRVSVLSCQAITSGGVRISLPAPSPVGQADSGNVLTTTFPLTSTGGGDTTIWVFLFVHPFEKQASGSLDMSENPPRFPVVLPTYTIQLVNETEYKQYSNHPYAMPIGKIAITGSDIKIEDDYIPPCISVNAHADLISLHAELDKYLADVELYCSQIVQKIYKKDQKNEISELVMFLCDRTMLYLGQAITEMRWTLIYDPPANMFAKIATLARVMKNTIDLRIGSGKDELMTYLSEWCELKQGELETMLSNIANNPFHNNDLNKNIKKVVSFVKVTLRLFETLSKLEFIGKRRESGIFVKEERVQTTTPEKSRRRFFE